LRELGLEDEERREHYPTSLDDFRHMEKFLRPRTKDEVFLDYGAGLGRVLVLAAMLPFKRVVGIELSPILAGRAQENISICERKFRCKDVGIIVADATNFQIPQDVTTIYFNNPFAGEILKSVLNKIETSYEERPRSIRIVCNLPSESAFLSIIGKCSAFELKEKISLGEERQCCVFSVRGQLAQTAPDAA
jgi:SAM-dependent methyltransferase